MLLTGPQDTVAPHSYFCWSAAIMIVTNTSSSSSYSNTSSSSSSNTSPLVLTINTSAACSPGGGLVYFTSTLADTGRLSPYLQWRHMGRPPHPSPQQVTLAWPQSGWHSVLSLNWFPQGAPQLPQLFPLVLVYPFTFFLSGKCKYVFCSLRNFAIQSSIFLQVEIKPFNQDTAQARSAVYSIRVT